MRRSIAIASITAAFIWCSSCATNIAKHSVQATLTPMPATDRPNARRLASATNVPLRSGFSVSSLKQGSEWKHIGSIDEGLVYRSVNWILMARTGHAHEAYIVVKDADLVGIFLPAEQVFVASKRPVPIHFEEVH